MKTIADQLPPDVAAQIHSDRRKNELANREVRDQLLAQYKSQWIGFADGRVVASGASPVAVL
jgi:exoribonuclease II